MELEERLKAALAHRYQIEREIGSGGMATVYLAQDLKHDRKVAVKVLRPELSASIGAERFLREIQISAKLNHPHILTLIDSGDADGLLYYVMPLVEGESLRDRLEREGQLPLDEAFKITRDVADGLGYAHRLDIVHRDIKPENVLLSEGHAVVTDFGIAKAVSIAGGRITKTGGSVGSPLYMSPEQAAGQESVDGRSDLYSLACMLFEMLAGEPPFTGQSVQALLAKHAMEPPPDVRVLRASVPEPVGTAIRKALSKSPADRFKTVGGFSAVLSTISAMGEAGAWDRAKPLLPERKVITPSSITVRGRRGWSSLFLGAALLGSTVFAVFKAIRAGPEQSPDGNGVWTPGAQVEQRQITNSGDVQWAALSPDGSYLLFTKERSEGLFLMRAVPQGEERLLTEREVLGPRWTPGGDEILFYDPGDDGREKGIYAFPIDGGQARWIAPGAVPIAVSPDGTRLVRRLFWDNRYHTSDERNTFIVSRLDDPYRYDTLAMKGVGYVSGIEWSPNGKELLVFGIRRTQDHQSFLELRSPDGTLLDSVLGGAFVQSLSWVPGGGSVLFSTEDTLRLAKLESGPEVIEPIIQFNDIPISDFSLSSNGRRLAFVRRRTTSKLMVAEVFGGGHLGTPRLLSGEYGVENVTSPVFSPDELQMAFVVPGGTFILVAPLSGGVVNKVVDLDGVPDDLSWSTDGSTLGFSIWDSDTNSSTLFTVPARGGPLRILGAVESLTRSTPAGKGLWISPTGDSLFYNPRIDTILTDGSGVNDLGPQRNRILWTDGRRESSIPLAPQRLEHWGTLGPTGGEWISVATEGFTVLSLADGSIVREIPLVPPDLPGPSAEARRVGLSQDGMYYLGPVAPLVWTSDDWIYFGYEFPPTADSGSYLEFWRVRADGSGGGVPEPALLDEDGAPRRFRGGTEPVLSAQARYVAWIERESKGDVWIAEVSPEGVSGP